MNKTTIIIAGIGGVGGYFGGLLAKQFYRSDNIEVDFIARGENLATIQKNGVTVIKGNSQFIARPSIVTDNPSEIGIADFIIICTKSYGLEAIIQKLRPCINNETIILPLLNGVDSKERIHDILPDNIVLEGCVYIVSRLKQAGIVENRGNIQRLYFGLDNIVNEKLILLENLFNKAAIEASLSQNISTIIWEKFIFISPTATATSYFDLCIGELLGDTEKRLILTTLIEEVQQIAAARQIIIAEDITKKTLQKLEALPFETTSSMHSDFQQMKPDNELESLTGYVVREGQKYNLATPMYKAMYEKMCSISLPRR
jgi:2-dehydropantoate 2-reductase